MSDVLFEKRGAVGLITLNRPQALNALTHAMCVEMKAQLEDWANDSAVKFVVIRGEGERAFCAGGDIRALYESGRAKTPYALDFYRDEYRLDAAVRHYPKPYISLLHGIVMGGGVGVSVNGINRVGDDSLVFAMPETGIGLFPDVGGSYFLPRLPGEIGMYLALTGARLDVMDALYAGIVTRYVPAANTEDLLNNLANGTPFPFAVGDLVGTATTAPLAAHRATIDKCFSGNSVEEILSRLDAEGSEWAAELVKTLLTKSPTSLKVTYRQIREGKKLKFDECLKMEFRMVNRIIAGHDFYEGVRATIIEKDNAPKWKPADLAHVTDAEVDAYFAPLDKELEL